MASHPTNHTFAVLIGIGDYRAYNRTDDNNLPGAPRDAALFHDLLTSEAFFGVPDDHVRGLVVEPGGEVPSWAHGRPTRDAIFGAMTWLGQRLREAAEAGQRATALVTYSGHGFAASDVGDRPLGTSLAIVPCDARSTTRGACRDAVFLEQLVAAIEATGADASDITWVADACYAKLDGSAPPVPASSGRADGRFLLGSHPWESSYELFGLTRPHGAFSFAIASLLEQWDTTLEDGVRFSQASYGELMNRARQLLEALGVAQRPFLVGSPRVELMPFLRPGEGIAAGATAAKPNRPKQREQIDPAINGFSLFSVRVRDNKSDSDNPTWVTAARVIQASSDYTYAPADGDVSFQFYAGVEYWFLCDVDAKTVLPSSGTTSPMHIIIFERLYESQDWEDIGNELPTNPTIASALPFSEFPSWNNDNLLPPTCSTGQAIVGPVSCKDTADDPPYALAAVFGPSLNAGKARLYQLYWYTSNDDPGTGFFGSLATGTSARFHKAVPSPSASLGWIQDFTMSVPWLAVDITGATVTGTDPGTGAFTKGNNLRYALAYQTTYANGAVGVGPMTAWGATCPVDDDVCSIDVSYAFTNVPASDTYARLYRQVWTVSDGGGDVFSDDECLEVGLSVADYVPGNDPDIYSDGSTAEQDPGF